MNINDLFKHSNSIWVKYDEYDLFKAADGKQYIGAADNAKPKIFNPLDNAEEMVVDALNIGLICMNKDKTDDDIFDAISLFIGKYGLLGFMTALPTTPEFMNYEAVYLPKNRYIREESMNTMEYLNIFYPMDKPQILRNGVNTLWTVDVDKDMMALAMTMDNRPMAVNMEFQREYAERYDWIIKQFKDWALIFFTSVLYYDKEETLSDDDKDLMRQALGAFNGIMPNYHIEPLDKPTLVWDFQSLLLAIQIIFSFMLADDKTPLKMCKQCSNAFVAKSPTAKFCSQRCKNHYYRNKQ